MNQKTKNIIKWVAIAVFVPTTATLAYYGGKKVFQFVKKKREEKAAKNQIEKVEEKTEIENKEDNGNRQEQI